MFNSSFTVPHWTRKQSFEAVEHYDLVPWVERAGAGMKRIRVMALCLVYYDMEIGEEYPTEALVARMIDRDSGGPSSMVLSSQRIGYFLSLFMRKGFVERTRKNGRSYYKRLI